MERAIDLLGTIFLNHKVCKSHGIDHAIKVMQNAEKALQEENLPTRIQQAVKYAALLHDADDRKFFPEHHNFENARAIIRECIIQQEDEPHIIRMIELVSAAKNGNEIPADCKKHKWMLIPRWCDRIEALGWGGVVRCWDYTRTAGRPLYTENTKRATSLNDLHQNIATPDRYQAYRLRGDSESMIDHYYDKILHIGEYTSNTWINGEMRSRMMAMEFLCLFFGRRGFLNDADYDMAVELSKQER